MPNLPPGPSTPGPLNILKFQRRTTELLETGRERYGHVWTLNLVGGTTFVMVSDPQLVEDVLTADPDVLHAEARLATPLVGDHSLLIAQGKDHATKRKLLKPLFQGERVERHAEVIATIAEKELAGWPTGEPMPLLPRLQAITLGVITSATFGETGAERHDQLRSAVHNLLDFGSSAWRMTKHQFRYMRGWQPSPDFRRRREVVNELVYEEISRAREDPDLDQRDDMLAMLLRIEYEDGRPFSDEEVRDQVVTLLMQGHTSTANGLAWALERVLRHPDIHDRLRSDPSNDDYYDAVVSETLRLRPPLPFVMRYVNEPYELAEWELDHGKMIAANLYILQRREDLFDDPDRFRPERFIDRQPDKFAWIPFGGGTVRGCIGRSLATVEMKVVLQTLMRQAHLEPADQADEEIKRLGVGFTPGRGARAVLKERVQVAGTASVR
jgi:cytochrome P450